MSGPSAETSHGSSSSGAPGFDLLRRATQAMMSRAAATDDDGSDQIGFETPRSGVATPQPDLHDKRLPGIMSYFGQVRPGSLKRLLSGTFNATGQAATTTPSSDPPLPEEPRPMASQPQTPLSPVKPVSSSTLPDDGPPLLPHEMVGLPTAPPAQEADQLHPYPTPPASQRSSLRNYPSDASGERSHRGTTRSARPSSLSHINISDLAKGKLRANSLLAPLSVTVDGASVSAAHISNPAGRACTAPSSPSRTHFTFENPDLSSHKSASVTHLKKLTSAVPVKSGASTPTRALSTTQPSQAETQDDVAVKKNGDAVDRSASHTPAPQDVQAPAAKGKLTIKILEAKGLRKCRDPYVVAVFQRSELISGGPQIGEEEATTTVLSVATSAIPMKRQGSDSGRPMAIPMRSRQSSNTSIHDHSSFRNRNTRRSFTNPKWDAEAVFDVVDSDTLVDVSVYDHAITGDEFLGHVDFQAKLSDGDEPVRGWFPLRGHADTMAENTPTGEIYVEALYQKSERKHVGPEDFEILRLIGKGTFGQVYQVRKKDTRRIYAMKVLSKKVIVQKKEVAHTVGERNILVRTATSDSPFIVGLKFSFQTPSDLYLVTDYMSGGELFWHLQKDGRFDEHRAKFYIAELILAIQHLHRNDIVYRDLKPENILLDANGHIALCDFGLSKANLTKNDTTNTFCGTTEYLAPEVLLDESGYTKMVDFWSLGVLVFEMCCGWSPFYAEDTQQMYKNIAFGKVRFPRETLSTEGRNFVKGLLNRNPKHRLGATDDAEELKRHPFFGDIDWDALSKKLITPPFKPQLKSETDVSYFDPEFTTAMDTNGSLNERAAALAKGFATSTPLSPSVQANFKGFTFVDESVLDNLPNGRQRYSHGDSSEDEDMDDVDNKKDDDEWDDLGLETKDLNRMSGIVKTNTNDEQMFGNSHFDE